MRIGKGIGEESYKLLIRSRGIWILLIFFTLKIILLSTGSETAAYQNTMKAERLSREYYAAWGGSLTPKKDAEIEARYQKIQQADGVYRDAMDRFSRGEIGEGDIEAVTESVLPLIEEKEVFQEFYEQVISVREDPENRHLINTQGWDSLLAGRKQPDFILLFCILVLSVLIFSIESRNGMYPLLTSTRYGRRRIVYQKLLTAGLCVIVASLLFQGADLMAVGLRFTLTDAAGPVQSLAEYRNTPYPLSLRMTALCVAAVRTVGLFYVSTVVLCFTEVFRRGYVGLFTGICVSLLPYFLFSENREYMLLPLPAGLLSASGYFTGPVYRAMSDGSQELFLRGVTSVEFVWLLAGVLTLVLLLCFGLYRHYTHTEQSFKWWKGRDAD